MKQPEALRLADLNESTNDETAASARLILRCKSAAELRRQHALIAELVEALESSLSLIESQRDRIGYATGSIYDKKVKSYAATLSKAKEQ